MLLKAYYPLFSGKEYAFKVVPYDPRDIFRGNYAVLRYNMNSIDPDSIPFGWENATTLNYGDPIYVILKQEGIVFEPVKLQLETPSQEEYFIKGIVESPYFGSGNLQLRYGIESFFANEELAQKIELSAQNGGDSLQVIAKVMISPQGIARIKEIECNDCTP